MGDALFFCQARNTHEVLRLLDEALQRVLAKKLGMRVKNDEEGGQRPRRQSRSATASRPMVRSTSAPRRPRWQLRQRLKAGRPALSQ